MKKLRGYRRNGLSECPITEAFMITNFNLSQEIKRVSGANGDACHICNSPIKIRGLRKNKSYRLRFGKPYPYEIDVQYLDILRTKKQGEQFGLSSCYWGKGFYYYHFRTLTGGDIFITKDNLCWEIHPFKRVV